MNISTPCKRRGALLHACKMYIPRADATFINKLEEENGQGTLAQALRRNAMYETNILNRLFI